MVKLFKITNENQIVNIERRPLSFREVNGDMLEAKGVCS
jgi:hypothetical protein